MAKGGGGGCLPPFLPLCSERVSNLRYKSLFLLSFYRGVACPMTYEGDPGDPQVGSYKLKLPFFRAVVRLKQYML